MYCIGHVPDVYSIGVSVWKSSKSNDRVGVLKYIPCSRLKVRHNFCFYYILNSNKRRFIDWVLEVIRERILIGMRYMRMVSNSKESRKLYYLVVCIYLDICSKVLVLYIHSYMKVLERLYLLFLNSEIFQSHSNIEYLKALKIIWVIFENNSTIRVTFTTHLLQICSVVKSQ